MAHRMQYSISPAEYMTLQIVIETANFHKKHYCFPNQATILKSLKLRFNRTMSKRQLCRHMKSLEKAEYIVRKKRHRKGPDGSLELHSTLYKIMSMAWKLFRSIMTSFYKKPGSNAVTPGSDNTYTTVVSQPQKPAKSVRASSATVREGLRQLKDILQT